MDGEAGTGAGAVLVQLVPFILFNLILLVPYWRILRRAGRSGWWVLLMLIPAVGWLVVPWVIAFMRWERPKEDLGQVFG